MSSSATAQVADELGRQLGAESGDEVIGDVAKNAISNQMLALIEPYEEFLPLLLAAVSLTLVGMVNAVVKMLVPILASLTCKMLRKIDFLNLEKVMIEVEVLK